MGEAMCHPRLSWTENWGMRLQESSAPAEPRIGQGGAQTGDRPTNGEWPGTALSPTPFCKYSQVRVRLSTSPGQYGVWCAIRLAANTSDCKRLTSRYGPWYLNYARNDLHIVRSCRCRRRHCSLSNAALICFFFSPQSDPRFPCRKSRRRLTYPEARHTASSPRVVGRMSLLGTSAPSDTNSTRASCGFSTFCGHASTSGALRFPTSTRSRRCPAKHRSCPSSRVTK